MNGHPAPYSDAVLAAIGTWLPTPEDVQVSLTPKMSMAEKKGLPVRPTPPPLLDPMAGVGTIHELARPGLVITASDIEDWPDKVGPVERHDATALPAEWTDWFDVLATSLTFGNRMADNYAGDGTRRHTYRIGLGQRLQSHNTGRMQWGKRWQVFSEFRPGGLALVEIKDTHRHVTDWTMEALRLTAETIRSGGLGIHNGVKTVGILPHVGGCMTHGQREPSQP